MELLKNKVLQAGLLLVAVAGLIYALLMYNGKEDYMDTVAEIARENELMRDEYEYQDVSQKSAVVQDMQDTAQVEKATEMSMGAEDPVDLLPSYDEETAWARSNPETSGTVHSQSFLEAGHHYGVNTQDGSLKNQSYDIRSTPPIPKEDVGLWNNSTMIPDPFRKQLKIGPGIADYADIEGME